MSRIGKSPVKVPNGINIQLDGKALTVNGSKGAFSMSILPGIDIKQSGDELVLTRHSEDAIIRARHGLMRSLVQNMITGVSEGFSKKLEIHGVGFRVNQAGQDLKFNLGYSHDITYKLPEGITANVDQNLITISGISKQQVGQVSAEIRALKKPEPYKGKGIRFEGERIIRKSGKSAKDKA